MLKIIKIKRRNGMVSYLTDFGVAVRGISYGFVFGTSLFITSVAKKVSSLDKGRY